MKYFFTLLTLTTFAVSQNKSADSISQRTESIRKYRFEPSFIYGNVHGLAIGVEYKLNDQSFITFSAGLKSPRYLFLDPPFTKSRINITIGAKYFPLEWLLIDCGYYMGQYFIGNHVWISAPIIGIGFAQEDIELEIGGSFNMPSKIQTSVDKGLGEILETHETRTRLNGFLFPFMKITYKPF